MAQYVIEQRVVDGQLVDCKVYQAVPSKAVQGVVRVGKGMRGSGARYMAMSSSQVLRCSKCSCKITREEEEWGGTCTRC